jgi:hypothetical protein
MALATAMYYSGRNPLKKLGYKSERLSIPKKLEQRRLQKAFLRYHDEKNWPMLREALINMGRADLIGNGPQHLIPPEKKRSQWDAIKPVAKARKGNATKPRRGTR